MTVETSQLSAQYLNKNFINKLENGQTKEAEEKGSLFLRKEIREHSIARKILTPMDITEDELDQSLDSDQPMKIVEKEIDTRASFVPFRGTGEHKWFYGDKYAVKFGKIETERFSKSKFELMTYRNDIRKYLTDNAVYDMANQEDDKFFRLVDSAIALDAATQSIDIAGATTVAEQIRNAVVAGYKRMVEKRKPLGKIVMAKSLYLEVLKLEQAQVGDTITGRHYDKGIEGEESLWGVPVITTIKSGSTLDGNKTIIKDDEIYFMPHENFLGNFFLLQDATLYIKQEADIFTFWSYSAPGIGIGVSDSLVKTVLL
jgi:hypothetical protein